jgi:aspartokinase
VDVQVVMISKGASKVNVSLVVHDKDGDTALQALHSTFFGPGSEHHFLTNNSSIL